MRQDWTPAVLITAAVSVVTAALVWFIVPAGRDDTPGPAQPRRHLAEQVEVWVGEMAPGLVGVLAPVYGDAEPDLEHEGTLNRGLGLEGDAALGYLRLLLFNRTDEALKIRIDDEFLAITKTGGQRVPLRSLPEMVARGEVAIPAELAFSLGAIGTLRREVEIPPRQMANLVVPFDQPAPLDAVRGVRTVQGAELAQRPISRADLQRLMLEPSERRVENLLR